MRASRSALPAFVFLVALLSMLPGRLPAALPEASRPKAKSSRKSDPASPAVPPADSDIAQRVAKNALGSLVVISHYGREGKSDGVGAGFAISSDGLIATSLHVIGEGRPIDVQAADGSKLEVVEITAWDRRFDLALIRVKGKSLPALPLGNSDSLRQGDEVVALGNPMGLEHSVVRGVVSAQREIEGVSMVQVAIPIEPGNSGGPLLDMKGQVQGVMALKSMMTANLGFAVPVNDLRLLVERPNPIPMDRWLNMGSMDTNAWDIVMGARWRQRVDRVVVDGTGDGFGGRALCLSHQLPPEGDYEIAVSVKLDDEAGAAGLTFASDGDLKHYGFYPTAGQLRLTRFDGANVFSWTILEQAQSPFYRSGDWNEIRVRVDAEKIRCFVNDHPVFESADRAFVGRRVGLCKFRNTKADFKRFTVGAPVDHGLASVAQGVNSSLQKFLDGPTPALEREVTETVLQNGEGGRRLLASRAAQLEKNAAELRRLSRLAHARHVEAELKKILSAGEEVIDLTHAALLLALYDDPELDVESYRRHVDTLAQEIRRRVPEGADERGRLKALRDYFFKEQGFHGSRHDYYEKANSYLNLVMEQREGIPISLSVLFMELGRKIGLEGLKGHPLPGHFMVILKPKTGADVLIDVFEGGRELSHAEADLVIGRFAEGVVKSETTEPSKKREIISRMIRNLLSIAEKESAPADSLHYLDLLLALQPDSALDRLQRARLRAQANDGPGAKEDVQWLLDHSPPGVDLDRLQELLRSL